MIKLFRRKLKSKKGNDQSKEQEPTYPTVQCRMMKEMSSRIAKQLGRTKDGDNHIYEDSVLYIKITNDHINVAIKAEHEGETLHVPVFIVLVGATMPRLYQAGPWTDHVINDLYPRATRKAWDKAPNMRDLGAIETPDVETDLITNLTT